MPCQKVKSKCHCADDRSKQVGRVTLPADWHLEKGVKRPVRPNESSEEPDKHTVEFIQAKPPKNCENKREKVNRRVFESVDENERS